MTTGSQASTRLLTQAEAVAVDEALMATPGFSVDQLMEIAGLSVAAGVADAFDVSTHRRVLCVCGPGNNGGDGLVAARHLQQFGYVPTVVYPKQTSRPLFINLVAQMEMCSIPVLQSMPPQPQLDADYDVILDAVFGFSFNGAVRAPFDSVLPAMRASALPVASVDIPSGWDVELGPRDDDEALRPQVLISLTMPKLCAAHFQGAHYLGGRFVPPTIATKFGFEQPSFPGIQQVLLLHPSKSK